LSSEKDFQILKNIDEDKIEVSIKGEKYTGEVKVK
jgi:hypothetical protein